MNLPVKSDLGTSVSPILMPYRQPVQLASVEFPFGHEAVHERQEAGVVRGLQQVGHFVYHDVLQAFRRLFGEFGIEADAPGGGAAAAPFGLHPLHEDPPHPDAYKWLPLGNNGGYG